MNINQAFMQESLHSKRCTRPGVQEQLVPNMRRSQKDCLLVQEK
jgi:hypothetical protein